MDETDGRVRSTQTSADVGELRKRVAALEAENADRIEPEYRAGLAAAEEKSIRTLSHFDEEVAFRRTDGTLRWGGSSRRPGFFPTVASSGTG